MVQVTDDVMTVWPGQVLLHMGQFCPHPQGTSGNVWGRRGLSHLGLGELLAPRGRRQKCS